MEATWRISLPVRGLVTEDVCSSAEIFLNGICIITSIIKYKISLVLIGPPFDPLHDFLGRQTCRKNFRYQKVFVRINGFNIQVD